MASADKLGAGVSSFPQPDCEFLVRTGVLAAQTPQKEAPTTDTCWKSQQEAAQKALGEEMELASTDDCLAGEVDPSTLAQAVSSRAQGAPVGTSEGWGPGREG